MPEGTGRYAAIANGLNAQGVKTVTGGVWTSENVRQAIRKQRRADETQ
ncbi:recombinase family protein [Microvirga massiliensis]